MCYNSSHQRKPFSSENHQKEGLSIMSKPANNLKYSGENPLWGALGYLIFFLPLIVRPSSKFYRFCANQGLLLWLAKLAFDVLFGILGWLLGWVPLVGWVISLVGWLINLAFYLMMIYYGFKAYNGQPEYLPLIGEITLIR